MIKFVCLCIFLLVCSPPASAGLFDDLLLRAKDLNPTISDVVRRAYYFDSEFVDSVATRYGSFLNPSLSFSSGPAATLNFTIVGNVSNIQPTQLGIAQNDIISFWTPRVTSDFRYIEFGPAGGINYNTSDMALIAHQLIQFMVGAKVYGQFHKDGHIVVSQLSEDRFLAISNRVIVARVANAALGFFPFDPRFQPVTGQLFPTMNNQTVLSLLYGRTENIYRRVKTLQDVNFFLESTYRYSRAIVRLSSPLSWSELPFGDYPLSGTEYPM